MDTLLGYMGKMLRVDLTARTIKEERIDVETARALLGGAGYAARVLHDEVPGDTPPLSPANKVIFMTGPLTGTVFPTTARYEVCTKSPLTNMWLATSSAGWWARDFKLTGYDGLIVEGAADSPVYLWIQDGKVEIRDASRLWGLDSDETQAAIRKELGDDKVRISCIGQAGEKQIPLACIMNDEQRAAGRGGSGAVMGSKNLKAVACRGTQRVPVADEATLKAVAKQVREIIKGHPVVSQFTPYGTASLLEHSWVTGDSPNKNWSVGLWREGTEKLTGRRMAETMLVPHQACQGCFIRCARWIRIPEGRFAMEGPGPEYETLAAFGTMLLNDNMEAVCWANDLCNRSGVDTISTGSVIAFAMEAYEKGIITKEDAGCELTWGNVEAIIEMTEQICSGRDLGALLGKGVKRAAEELGRGSEDFAIHVKGLEAPYHDPRAYTSLGVSYATGTRGACHMHGNTLGLEEGAPRPDTIEPMGLSRFDQKGKGLMAMLAQDKASVVDSMVLCMITSDGMVYPSMAAVLEAATGEPWSPERVAQTGERITNLQRVYSMKCGITGADDRLPKRLLTPTAEGGQEGHIPDITLQLKEYYQVRGWDENGRPTNRKLEELGLLDIVGDF